MNKMVAALLSYSELILLVSKTVDAAPSLSDTILPVNKTVAVLLSCYRMSTVILRGNSLVFYFIEPFYFGLNDDV